MELDADILEMMKGFLAKKLWVVMTRRSASVEDMALHLKAHLENQILLEKQGIMYAAGPCMRPGEPEPAFGMFILRAANEQEARHIADADPMHAAGVRTYELFEWTMNEGQLRISLNFSDQTYRIE